MANDLTHINAKGEAHMVDVGAKAETSRTAIASGKITMVESALQAIISGTAKKGDVVATARVAGIMAAKRTSDLIPLCHPLPLTHITLDITPDTAANEIIVTARVETKGQTGVEMEALTAVSVTCLTLYDMAKALDKSMVISDIQLEEKHGGKSGTFKRSETD